jgi:hypothetical protein
VDTQELLAIDREQSEGVVLAQVALDAERQARQVAEALDVPGGADARGVQALARGRDALEQAPDERAQAFELQRVELLARRDLDLRWCARGRSSCARGCSRERG